MATNVEVTKGEKDNNLGLIRKFTKRVQGSGVLSRVRGIRYNIRKSSEYVKKKKALKKIEKRQTVRHEIKMGKRPGTLD